CPFGSATFAGGLVPGSDQKVSQISISPAHSRLAGRRPTQQLIATASVADGSRSDATRTVGWVSRNPEIAVVSAKGRVVPRANGHTTIQARQGQVVVEASVEVAEMQRPDPVSFRRDVIPAFSQAGCNMGACHGTPTGKGGFRLSLRGYLPDQDF